MMFPVVLGSGKRLFGDPGAMKKLRLADSKVVGDGIVILTYTPAPAACAIDAERPRRGHALAERVALAGLTR